MTFTFTHEPSELYRAYRTVAFRRPAYRALTVALCLLPFAAVARDLIDGASVGGALTQNLVWLIFLPAWALLGIPLLHRLGARRALARYPTLQGAQTIELTDEGMRIANRHGESMVPWSELHEAVETPEFVFIYVNRQRAFHIPRRSIRDADMPALRSLLRAKLPGRARLLGPSAA